MLALIACNNRTTYVNPPRVYDAPVYQNQQPSYLDDNYYYFQEDDGSYRPVRRTSISYEININKVSRMSDADRDRVYKNTTTRDTAPTKNPFATPAATPGSTAPKSNPFSVSRPARSSTPQPSRPTTKQTSSAPKSNPFKR